MPDLPENPPKLLESMPRPLLAVFLLTSLTALGVVLWLVVRPPTFGEIPVEERRPAPAAPFAHDPVEVFPAPTPATVEPIDAPCEMVAGARPVGGLAFGQRVRDALESICTLQGGSVPEAVTVAAHGLADAAIRIAEFQRNGVESTVDLVERTIWVNLRLTRRVEPFQPLIPVLLHEGYHLASVDGLVSAEDELAAREVELFACREFIRPDDWPRPCEDARDLLAADDPVALLVSAGFVSEVSS